MSSTPPLSPVRPSTHSISNTSIVEVSISTPSFASRPSGDEDRKYTCPRPAPHPPSQDPKATKKGDALHRESNCCIVDINANLPSTPATPIPTPISSSIPTEWAIPTPPQITHAASLQLTCEDGTHVSFGSLFENTRTIVVFIRHFWCPLCQDYMSSLKSLVRPEMLSAWPTGDDQDAKDLQARLVSFVVISNGAYGMIHKYKQIFGLPFKVYTDPTLAIYKALGMGRDGDHRGHGHLHDHNRIEQEQQHHYQRRLEKQASVSGSPSHGLELPAVRDGSNAGRKFGGYVKHGLIGGIAMVVVRAIKVGMPVWQKGGDIDQLGGEFIFGPGSTCSFAHRMQTTKGHAPIEDVLAAAGIDVNAFDRPNREEEQYRDSTPVPGSFGGDLLFLPTTPPTPTPNPPRRRLSSLKSLKGSLSRRNRGTSTSGVAPLPVTLSFNTGRAMVDEGAQSRRHTGRFSMGMLAGMMSREEEDNWMEQRRLSIERLQEKKNFRRGMMGRAFSAQSYQAQVLEAEVLAVGGSGEPEPVKEKTQWPSSQESHWEAMSELEVVGKMDDVEEEQDEEWDQTMDAPARRSLESMTDTASSYSNPSATAMPLNGGSYVFTDTDDEAS